MLFGDKMSLIQIELIQVILKAIKTLQRGKKDYDQ